MKYELWQEADGFTFFPEDNQSSRQMLTADAVLLHVIEAETWTEAMIEYHKYMGWEPYKPMGEV